MKIFPMKVEKVFNRHEVRKKGTKNIKKKCQLSQTLNVDIIHIYSNTNFQVLSDIPYLSVFSIEKFCKFY